MRLQSGNRLGKFEIVSPIGSGGMGEVYKARDLELHREVVIKVLPEKMATRSRRLRRFKQEARAASVLNHPNIVTVYEIGDFDGTPYIVMEYVAGRTLRQVLADGPLSIDKILRCAVQLAEGLAKAHEAGIVHRDLKPENILINDDGYVKIVDFGLAKLLSQHVVDSEGTTVSKNGTTPGVMLGTLGYASPEQVRGHSVDVRSDQFAFGAVLYEMISGRRAFHARTRSEAISAIINQNPPPLHDLRPDVPEKLCHIVHRCLEKKPRQRFPTTSELSETLSSLIRSPLGASPSVSAQPARDRRRVLPAGGAALALVAVALVVVKGREDAFDRDPVAEVEPSPSRVMTSLPAPTPLENAMPSSEAAAPERATNTATTTAVTTTTATTAASTSAITSTMMTTIRVEPEPPDQVPTVVHVDEEAAIRETLTTFVLAIESEDLALYRRVKPNITVEEADRLRASFDSVDVHDVRLHIDDITIDGESASVRVRRTDVIVIRGREQDPSTRMQTFDLIKSGERWVIVRLRQ